MPTATVIDIPRCLLALERIYIEGVPNTREREKVIEDAILAIQTEPESALMKQYMAIKNYAAFGDQRADCEYGFSPRHGHIVFAVGRTLGARDGRPLGDEEVYLLEQLRDFGGFPDPEWQVRSTVDRQPKLNLSVVLRRLQRAEELATAYRYALNGEPS